MAGRSRRVAHVVQAVEHGHQVVPVAGEGRRRGGFEPDPAVDPGVGGPFPRGLDRAVVIVAAGKGGVREGLGHQRHGTGAEKSQHVHRL